MEHFPDRAVAEIVKGLEAAERLLAQGPNPLTTYSGQVTTAEAVVADMAAVDAGLAQVARLRSQRYLFPEKLCPAN